MKKFVLACITLLLTISDISAQSSRPDIFIDCQMYCQMNYIREQINFVNYMQNRQEADIYILATSQLTGAGGREVQLAFEGNNQFHGINDTISYYTDPNGTDAINRDQMVSELKKGLLKYIVQTDLIDQLNYSIDNSSEGDQQEDPVKDPWNYWVFNVGGNGWLSGEQSFSRMDLTGRFSANRITEDHKFEFTTRYNYEENTFTLTDGETFTSIFRTYNIYLDYVKSINDHWSIGGTSRSGSSTFGNTDINSTIKAAIEYNLFPYSEAQTRRFSFYYAVGPEYYDYTDLTIYDKMSEWVGRHGLTIEYEQTQKWGDLSLELGVQQYFHNLDLYNAYFNPYIELQIFKGLSLNIGGYLSFVNDRINIAKSDISDEDILLQIKQLDTDFTYFTHFGLNYRFGSSYNNFVNPRF